MAKIVGIDGMTVGQVADGVRAGGRFVVFEYCISILIMTFKRSSDVYYIPPGGGTAGRSIGYTLISLLLGWWGIPWGFIYTPMALATNLGGGKDVTAAVMSSIAPARTGR
jgi:hypothetical protein